MPRTNVNQEKSQAVLNAEQALRELKARERRQSLIDSAKQTMKELGSEYEHAKMVFFKVNGARRILKSE